MRSLTLQSRAIIIELQSLNASIGLPLLQKRQTTRLWRVRLRENPMLTVAEALDAIVNTVTRGPVIEVSLNDALGLVLAETIISDVDSPPFDKSLMDGYAVRAANVRSGQGELQVIEEVTAGRIPSREVGQGQAIRIMTGAPLPAGADAVVPVEETEFHAETSESALGRVFIRSSRPVEPEQLVLRRGAAVQRGAEVISPGTLLRAQEVAALAELGHARVAVIKRPCVAILATGDELVSADQPPGPGQIRNSNEPMLAAQVEQAGAQAIRLGIARDERGHLREKIETGLSHDFLLLSGGVSAGKLDLVPSELAAAGVREVFHKIQMKPGKPLWFGVLDRADGTHCYVFGLPGNPVSSMVCCELFVRAALRRWHGIEPAIAEPIRARLTVSVSQSSNRPTYHPAHLTWTSGGPRVSLVDWIGSSDVCATVEANCTVLLKAGDHSWNPGDILEAFPW